MKRLRSHVEGRWHEADAGFVPLVDPSTEAVLAEASSSGVDFGAALEYARGQGRSALAELTIPQ